MTKQELKEIKEILKGYETKLDKKVKSVEGKISSIETVVSKAIEKAKKLNDKNIQQPILMAQTDDIFLLLRQGNKEWKFNLKK